MANYLTVAVRICLVLMNYFKDANVEPDNISSTLNYTTFKGHFQVATIHNGNLNFIENFIDNKTTSYQSFTTDFTKKLNNKALCVKEKGWVWSDSVTCFV